MQSLKTAIGLMSGTSMDGIDAALIRSDGQNKVDILAHLFFDYPQPFRSRLKQGLDIAQSIKARQERPGNLGLLEETLTFYHAQIVRNLLLEQNLQAHEIDLIGFHGQTILHRPEEGVTVQLGQGAMLARQTGIDVISDMRANDVAHGGQGAPLVPVYHAALAAKLRDRLDFPCCFVNVGGIANLTYLPEADMRDFNAIMAFDCGPGNCLIDQWMESRVGLGFDADGQMGLRGKVHETVIKSYLDAAFFLRHRPKSLDWHDFPPLHDDKLSLEDGAATLAALTAQAIFHSFRFLPQYPKSLVISGGGVKNFFLMKILGNLAKKQNISLIKAEECGLQADFIEAEAWGYLAIRSAQGLPLSFPATTGVQFPVTGGIFHSASL